MIDKTTVSLFELLYLIVTAGGFILVSIQLRYVLLQVRLQTRQTEVLNEQTRLLSDTINSNANASVASLQQQVDRLFVDRPHLRTYFLESQAPENDHLCEAKAAAMLVLNYFDSYFLQRDRVPQLFSSDAWESYMGLHFANSPFLCEFLVEHARLYTMGLADLMKRSAARRIDLSRKDVTASVHRETQ